MSCPTDQAKSLCRQQLLDYIYSHAVQGKIPSERVISQALSMNRSLMRKHLAAFEKEGLLYRRQRQGMYLTNPNSEIPVFGLMTGDGNSFSYLDSADAVAGFIQRINATGALIRNFTFRAEPQIPQRMKEYGLQGLAWIQPSLASNGDMLKRLILDQRLPIVIASTFMLPQEISSLDGNLVTYDCNRGMRLRAQFFAARKCHNLLYYSPWTDYTEEFRRATEKLGLRLPQDCILTELQDLDAKLPQLMRNYHIDGILCDGAVGYAENLLAFLHEHPAFKPVLRLENHLNTYRLQQQYPDIPVAFQCAPRSECIYDIGVQAADMLLKIAQTQQSQPARFVSNAIIDTLEPLYAEVEQDETTASVHSD